MICDRCKEAADSGNMSLHCKSKKCDCQHMPVGTCQLNIPGVDEYGEELQAVASQSGS